jgi:hypothetical protein
MVILLDRLRAESRSIGLSIDDVDLVAIAQILGEVKLAVWRIQFSEADGIDIPYNFDVSVSSRVAPDQRFRSPWSPG